MSIRTQTVGLQIPWPYRLYYAAFYSLWYILSALPLPGCPRTTLGFIAHVSKIWTLPDTWLIRYLLNEWTNEFWYSVLLNYNLYGFLFILASPDMTGKVLGTYCRWIWHMNWLELRKKLKELELESLLSPGHEVICICREMEIYALSLFELGTHKMDFIIRKCLNLLRLR